MANRYFLFFFIAIAIVALAELGVILSTLSPAQATPNQLWVFFITLFLSLVSLLSPIWYLIKSRLIYRGAANTSFKVCVRQTGLLALVTVLSLFFNSLGILTLWDIIPLGISMLLIEFFFQADTTGSPPSHVFNK